MFQNINIESFWLMALLRIAAAAAIFLFGRWLAGLVQRSVRTIMKRTRATPALTEILARGIYYVIQVLAISLALIVLGVPADVLLGTLGIIVIVAAIALRESLRDLAATVIFLVFQPFKVGDVIQTNGIVGQVQEILIFSTVLVSPNNTQIILPNGNIQNSTLVNLSVLDKVRLDLSVRLSYADGMEQVKDVLLKIARADSRVRETPAPFVQLTELGDSQVEYLLCAYTSPTDSFFVRPALNEQIKLLLEKRQLSLPLPQLQVHSSSSLQIDQSTALPGDG
jgi:small conductance mechanosensitive channel